MKLTQDLKEFIGLLNEKEVEYLLVGGWAVGYHAEPRYTGDFDFFVKASLENSQKLKSVLDDFGLEALGIKPDAFASLNKMFQFGRTPYRIDIITSIDGVSFEEAWEQRIQGHLDGLRLWIIGKTHLITNKIAAARPRDIADVVMLRGE